MERITSRQNPLVRRFRELAKAGRHPGQVLLEGSHLIAEALDAGVALDVVAVMDASGAEASSIATRAAASDARIVSVPAQVLAAISPVRHPSGIIAIGRANPASMTDLFHAGSDLILLVHGVQDPGNLGAIVRAADASGASGVLVDGRAADPFGWKALRGSMGSAFRLPIAVESVTGALAAARVAGLRTIATIPRGGVLLQESDLRRPCAIVLGGEGHGLDREVLAMTDERLTIPMRPPVESLNVAVAAGLILYEARRQRDEAGSISRVARRT